VQQWVGLINEIMNVDSWMVLKSSHCFQRNGKWKAWFGNRTVTKISMGVFAFVKWWGGGALYRGLYICAVWFDIVKFP